EANGEHAGKSAAPAATPPVKRVRLIPAYQRFPEEALPQPLRQYVSEAAASLGCDPAYTALPGLSVAAGLIGNARSIRLKRGGEEPCVLWTGVVGDSGTLKSPAYLKAVAHVFRIQRELLLEHREEMRTHKAALKKKPPGAAGEEPPVLRRVVCGDITIEKVSEGLEDNPRGILVAPDELAGWVDSVMRYKGKQGGTDLPNWLEMFRAGTVVVDRKTGDRKTFYVPRAAVSIAGSIQTGVLIRNLTPELLDAGLVARLLMGWPVAPPKRWTE